MFSLKGILIVILVLLITTVPHHQFILLHLHHILNNVSPLFFGKMSFSNLIAWNFLLFSLHSTLPLLLLHFLLDKNLHHSHFNNISNKCNKSNTLYINTNYSNNYNNTSWPSSGQCNNLAPLLYRIHNKIIRKECKNNEIRTETKRKLQNILLIFYRMFYEAPKNDSKALTIYKPFQFSGMRQQSYSMQRLIVWFSCQDWW